MRSVFQLKIILRSFASSSSNPLSKSKSFSVRNGNLGPFSYFSSIATATAKPSSSSPSPSPPPPAPPPLSNSQSAPKHSLYKKIMAANTDYPTAKGFIPQLLKEWVDEGGEVNIRDVRNIIKHLRHVRRYSHALQISEWIGGFQNLNLTSDDAAVRLYLIYKVQGLQQAERYFDSLPDDLRVVRTYGALLNCYVQAKLLYKAEAIMLKMRELGNADTLSYNNMLNLYAQMGKLEKLRFLVQEMETEGINFDKFSYNMQLIACVSTSDIMQMEELLMKMEADPHVVMEWDCYSVAANGYMKAGDIVKAETMLKKSEKLIKVGKIRSLKAREVADHAFEVLITQYATIGRKDEVYRLWKLLKLPKKKGKFFDKLLKWPEKKGKLMYMSRLWNRSYFCIISSLLKLDDVDGAQMMLDKWLTKEVDFDIRIPNLLVTAFCGKGNMEKAESVISCLVERGKEPNATTWSRMASGYCINNQMEDAVKMIKKVISTSYPGWRHDLPVLVSCLKYLKEKGDVDGAEEILGLLEGEGKCPFNLRGRMSMSFRHDINPSSPELHQMVQESDFMEEENFEGTVPKLEKASILEIYKQSA